MIAQQLPAKGKTDIISPVYSLVMLKKQLLILKLVRWPDGDNYFQGKDQVNQSLS
jgi:hypothetical protein